MYLKSSNSSFQGAEITMILRKRNASHAAKQCAPCQAGFKVIRTH